MKFFIWLTFLLCQVVKEYSNLCGTDIFLEPIPLGAVMLYLLHLLLIPHSVLSSAEYICHEHLI